MITFSRVTTKSIKKEVISITFEGQVKKREDKELKAATEKLRSLMEELSYSNPEADIIDDLTEALEIYLCK